MRLQTACVLSLAAGVTFSGFVAAGEPLAGVDQEPKAPAETPSKPVDSPSAIPANDETTTEQDSEADSNNKTFEYIEDYLAAIEEREAEHGAYSMELSEVLFELGQALQNDGQHDQALDNFQHALHINRVNNGLFHISQEPVLRAIISSHEINENKREIILLYEQLMRLYHQRYGESSPEMLPLLEEAASWHRQVYLENQSKDNIGHLIWSLSLLDTAFNIASRAPAQFQKQMIKVLKGSASSNWYMTKHFTKYKTFTPPENASFNPKVRVKLMRQVAAGTFNSGEQARHHGFINGRNAYQRIVSVLDDADAPPQQRAEALVELGDWFTIFGRPTSARKNYDKAWALLTEYGDTKTQQRLLGKPDKLPNFIGGSRGQGTLVKIAVDIDSKGRPRKIEVLKTFPEDDKQAAARATKSIRKSLFRPGYEDGEPVYYEDYTFSFRLKK